MKSKFCSFILLLCIALVCVTLVCAVLGNISHSVPVRVRDKAIAGMPYYFQDNSAKWGEITDYAVCEDVLYVLYSGKGILDCYSLDGSYLHSYSIALGEKGKAALYANNNLLHLKSRELTFYTFKSGFFEETYSVSATELHSNLQELTPAPRFFADAEYELKGASIWRNSHGAREEIVCRPNWMAVFQGNTLMLLGSFSFMILWVIIVYKKRK